MQRPEIAFFRDDYIGKPVTVRQVGRELGVRFVLEGSVQQADRQVRITAQLIEAASGKHIWAERYDRVLEDIFSLQDELVEKIVTALEVNLSMDQVALVRFGTTENVEAWNHYLRGLTLARGATVAEWQAAPPEFEKALKLDPEFEAAILGMGWSYYKIAQYGFFRTQYTGKGGGARTPRPQPERFPRGAIRIVGRNGAGEKKSMNQRSTT